MISNATFWNRLSRFPPILLRLLSRKRHGRPLSTVEISTRSGLTIGKINFISEHGSWDEVTLGDFKRFTQGCDINLLNRSDWRRVENYLAGVKINGRRFPPNFRYLRLDPKWETYFKPLLASWLKSSKKP